MGHNEYKHTMTLTFELKTERGTKGSVFRQSICSEYIGQRDDSHIGI